MKTTRFPRFLILTIAFLSVTGLASASDVRKNLELWNNSDQYSLDRSNTSKQIKSFGNDAIRSLGIMENFMIAQYSYDDPSEDAVAATADEEYLTPEMNANSDVSEVNDSTESHSLFKFFALALQKRANEFIQEHLEKYFAHRDPAFEQNINSSIPDDTRSFLQNFIYYPPAVILVTILVIAALIYRFMGNLHPSWTWEGKDIWNVISILYFGVSTSLLCYVLLYDPSRYFEVLVFGGILFFPFAIAYGMLNESPTEKIQNTIQDEVTAIRSPGLSLIIMIVRPFLKLAILCVIGGILIHVAFWVRSFLFIVRSLFHTVP